MSLSTVNCSHFLLIALSFCATLSEDCCLMSRQQTLDIEEEEGCREDGGKESEARWKGWEIVVEVG